jgi:DNA replication protein DnaC
MAPPALQLPSDDFRERVQRLGLHGVLARWEGWATQPWLQELVDAEEAQRKVRSLERRVRAAQIGRFKPLADFDWHWPSRIDRELVEELFSLEFLKRFGNVVFLASSGLGKTMLAKNLVHQAILAGYTGRFTTASAMLNDLASQESAGALSRRLARYTQPTLLAIDEVGYLSYGTKHADLLFEVVSRRAEDKSTLVTTNRVFSEWNEVFPNATSVVALVDRLGQRADVVTIEGESYRLREARERQEQRAAGARAKGERPDRAARKSRSADPKPAKRKTR